MHSHQHEEHGEVPLPASPLEERSLVLPSIRRVRAVYEDVVCEKPELAKVLGRAIRTPSTAAALAFELIGRETQEVFATLLLNGKHRLIGFAEVSRGTLTASLVHPREVFAPAFVERAASIIVAHNHPSGDPEPSAEDLAVTERLKAAGDLLGIPVLDHVIIGAPSSFVSLKERLKL